ncbi:molybdopterin-dependent oxidoreductase [Caenimonas koreensis]|uniref:molybdopterin-dependent oxidoreductase n=1 Tax=Caenimonas koreensis TaxID=367474 RepID=UPI003784AD5F
MKKRNFLGGAAAAAIAMPFAARAASQPVENLKSPTLLTVTGAVTKTNRGPLDPMLDQMLAKQKVTFEKAHAFTFEALTAMPASTIKPTIEYDKKVHTLRGPLLVDVLKACGVTGDTGKLAMRAVDGYSPTVTIADARKYRFIVATHFDGKPMPLGGLGPLWGVYEPDGFVDMAAKPVDARFANCPWALFHIDVQA